MTRATTTTRMRVRDITENTARFHQLIEEMVSAVGTDISDRQLSDWRMRLTNYITCSWIYFSDLRHEMELHSVETVPLSAPSIDEVMAVASILYPQNTEENCQ